MTLPSEPPPPETIAAEPSRWGSLKLRLAVIGALLIAASVALTVGLTLRSVAMHDEAAALDLSLVQTRRMARLISTRLVSLQLSLRSAGERFDTRKPPEADGARRFLAERAELSSQFDTLFVGRPDGQVIAFLEGNAVRTPELHIGDRPYFRETVQQGRPIISQPIVGRASNEPVVMLTMPLRGPGGAIVAVIGGSLRLATRDLMAEITADDDDDPSRTVITDAQGRVLSHPDRQWLMRDAALEPTLRGAMAHWITQGRPIEPSGLAGRFDDQLVSMAGVPDAEWMVVRSAPMAIVMIGGRQAELQALWIGAAVALCGGVLLLTITFVMLRPLRAIERCVLELTQGRSVDAAAWPRPNNELGRLASGLQRALEERLRADGASREMLDRLQAVMANSPVGIGFTRGSKYVAVSAHFHHLLGYPNGALVGQASRGIYASGAFYDELGPRVASAFAQQQPFDEETEFLRHDGGHFWGRLRGLPVRWGDPSAGTIWTLEDVTQQRQHRETLAWASSHDALTQLVNRAEFERRLASQCHNRRREPSSALFIDLDRFKAVNDSAGHAAGDAVLVAVARLLEQQVRQADTVARLGGDEYAILLNACDSASAAHVAEKMRAAVEALRVPWAETTLAVGASIGVVELDPKLADVAAVLAAADAACYAAKHGGRNGVRVHGAGTRRLVGSDA